MAQFASRMQENRTISNRAKCKLNKCPTDAERSCDKLTLYEKIKHKIRCTQLLRTSIKRKLALQAKEGAATAPNPVQLPKGQCKLLVAFMVLQ